MAMTCSYCFNSVSAENLGHDRECVFAPGVPITFKTLGYHDLPAPGVTDCACDRDDECEH